eukprot:663129-Pyramimonas_sp.AAC.1
MRSNAKSAQQLNKSACCPNMEARRRPPLTSASPARLPSLSLLFPLEGSGRRGMCETLRGNLGLACQEEEEEGRKGKRTTRIRGEG